MSAHCPSGRWSESNGIMVGSFQLKPVISGLNYWWGLIDLYELKVKAWKWLLATANCCIDKFCQILLSCWIPTSGFIAVLKGRVKGEETKSELKCVYRKIKKVSMAFSNFGVNVAATLQTKLGLLVLIRWNLPRLSAATHSKTQRPL